MTPISAALSKEDRDAVMDAVAVIKEKLPFLVDLNASERKSLPKMGDKSRAFVSKALEVATQNPDFLPSISTTSPIGKTFPIASGLTPLAAIK